jgi:hypothetical protein
MLRGFFITIHISSLYGSNILPVVLQSPFSLHQSGPGLKNKLGACSLFFGANVIKRESGTSGTDEDVMLSRSLGGLALQYRAVRVFKVRSWRL